MVTHPASTIGDGGVRGRPVLEVVADLRRQVGRIQGRPAADPVPVHPSLRGLLSVQAGGVYTVDAASLALLMLAGPSEQGAWCGVVGAPDLGVEAAVALGVDPARTVLVPEPGERWLEVTAALVDVLALVVVRPPVLAGGAAQHGAQRRAANGSGGGAGLGAANGSGGGAGPGAANGSGGGAGPGAANGTVRAVDASRVAARLRSRGSVLVPWGEWPGADARLSLSDVRWSGVGQGHGHLQARQATVEVRRGDAPARRRSLWLPAPDLTVRPVQESEVAAAVPGAVSAVRSA